MKMKVSHFIADFLRVQKTSCVFEVAGGMITHILDSIYQYGNTSIISVHHEQAAAFAAEAYGRCLGRPGVALATSGPGATNLLTGIGSCYFDSSPALFITGQVNTYELKGLSQVRQLGFQETDIVSMAKPITKACYQIQDPLEVESIFYDAYSLTINNRPGPVLIDIPMNIQRAEVDFQPIQLIERTNEKQKLDKATLELFFSKIIQAKRPLILVGNGVRCSKSHHLFEQFINLIPIPVVTSLLAIDTISFSDCLRVGMIGSYGNRWANIALGTCDLLIVLGSRLDIRQTGADTTSFKKDKTIIHIDCDQSEVNNRIKDCIPIISDLRDFLLATIENLKNKELPSFKKWHSEIDEIRLKWPDTEELKGCVGINPNHFIHELSSTSSSAKGYVVDVGAHQMWAAQSIELGQNQLFLTSGGMGAMGFSLPAAIGACLAQNKQPMVVIVGDGCLQMNIQELQTVVRNNLPIKIIVINNQALGMIRQFQDSYFEGRYQSTYWGYNTPNFVEIAKAYKIPARTINSQEEIKTACEWLWSSEIRYGLLEVMIDPKTNVYPKIAFGKPITEMEPFAEPEGMECT